MGCGVEANGICGPVRVAWWCVVRSRMGFTIGGDLGADLGRASFTGALLLMWHVRACRHRVRVRELRVQW